MLKWLLILSIFLLNTLFLQAQSEGKTFTVAQQQADFKILKQALERLHPGLLRFNTQAMMNQHFATLKKALDTPQTERSLLRVLSEFAAKIKCSHTYCNPWNIDKGVKQRLYGKNPKGFPFRFKMINERMIVTKDLSKANRLKKGDEIVKINGIPMQAIVAKLRMVIKKDGNAYPQQMAQMESYAFDYYFPLFFAVQPNYTVEAMPYNTSKSITFETEALTKAAQRQLHQARFGAVKTHDDLWKLEFWDNATAYLQIGTYVTWRLKKNWQKFLKQAFAEIKKKQSQRLVLDLRGNSGGLTEAAIEVLRYLYTKPFKFGEKTLVKNYRAEGVTQYLSTWDKKTLNPPARFFKKDAKSGMYEFLPGKNKIYKPYKRRFKGKVYVLCDAHNGSGGTSTLAHIQEQNLGVIVGQETGGSKEGPIGGQIFYLRLPNTHMEIDLPAMRGYMPIKHPEKLQKDKGVIPDIMIKKSVTDIAQGIDTELTFVKEKLIPKETTEK